MYSGAHVQTRPHQPAFIMAGTGEAVTYAELEARSNRLAHLLRSLGLQRLDHYAILMETIPAISSAVPPGSDRAFTTPASTRT
jgi:acyl-coenzyme A synthetase/AMP-(fatty) acid ligase